MRIPIRLPALSLTDSTGRFEAAIQCTAEALESLELTFEACGESLSQLQANQSTAEAALCQHDRTIDRLVRNLGEVHARLEALEVRISGPEAPTARARPSECVRPSDVEGFLAVGMGSPPTPGEVAKAVRTILEAMRSDLRLEPIHVEDFPWSGPLLLLCSASVDRLEAFLRLLLSHAEGCTLSVIGRARDLQVVRREWRADVDFHLYEAAGPYRLEECHFLPKLAGKPFRAKVFLDGRGLWGDRLDHCTRLLREVQPVAPFCYGLDGNLYRPDDSGEREIAETAMAWLLDWYDRKLQP